MGKPRKIDMQGHPDRARVPWQAKRQLTINASNMEHEVTNDYVPKLSYRR